MTSPGVSIVICCYNSVRRLGVTLEHLARQVVQTGLPWEVIVVDNRCTDGTAEFALNTWPKNGPAPLRVVSEPNPGKTRAFERGFGEAAYDFMCIVDDDNWVCPNWVNLVAEVMMSDPQIGVCGGPSEGVFEEATPAWFAKFSENYAIGEFDPVACDITWTRGSLWGAGHTVRKQAWQQLRDQGFRNELLCRCGKELSSGSDTELCQAIRLAGWKLYWDPRLRIQHYMPAGRIKWDYLCRLRHGFGVASVTLDAYNFPTKRHRRRIGKLVKPTWIYQVVLALRELAECGAGAISKRRRFMEGNEQAIKAEYLLGRLSALFQNPLGYGRRIRQIDQAPWRKIQLAPVLKQ